METVRIPTGTNVDIDGIVVSPGAASSPRGGALFLHGWGSQKEAHVAPAERLADLGYLSLTVDLRGHGGSSGEHESVSANDNLIDALAAYDYLAARPDMTGGLVAVAGFSYGGFLAVLLCEQRPVRWLALRSPALYRDEDMSMPKARISRRGLMQFRRRVLGPNQNIALSAALRVKADVLIVEAEHDRLIPAQEIRNFLHAFLAARSLTHVVIKDADHALSLPEWRQAAVDALGSWIEHKSQMATTAI